MIQINTHTPVPKMAIFSRSKNFSAGGTSENGSQSFPSLIPGKSIVNQLNQNVLAEFNVLGRKPILTTVNDALLHRLEPVIIGGIMTGGVSKGVTLGVIQHLVIGVDVVLDDLLDDGQIEVVYAGLGVESGFGDGSGLRAGELFTQYEWCVSLGHFEVECESARMPHSRDDGATG